MLRLPGRLAVWAAFGAAAPFARAAGSSSATWLPPASHVSSHCRAAQRLLWTTAAAWCPADPGDPGDPADPADPAAVSDEEWRARLTPLQFAVTRRAGTEPPFSGALPAAPSPTARYGCVCCGAALFRAGHKFDSGSGWPSFWAADGSGPGGGTEGTNVASRVDTSHGMRREEVLCRRCGAHLGHVFSDGPPPTGLRYCINAAALKLLDDG